MAKLTKEESLASAEEARRLWPEAFTGDEMYPHLTTKDAEELTQQLRQRDAFHARCQSRTKHTPKKGMNYGLSKQNAYQQ